MNHLRGGESFSDDLGVKKSPSKSSFDKNEDQKDMRYILNSDKEFRDMFEEMSDVFDKEGIFIRNKSTHYKKIFDKKIQEINRANESKGFSQVVATEFFQRYDNNIEDSKIEESRDLYLDANSSGFQEKVEYDQGFTGDFGFNNEIAATLEPLKNEEYENIDKNGYFDYVQKQMGIIQGVAQLSKFKRLNKIDPEK